MMKRSKKGIRGTVLSFVCFALAIICVIAVANNIGESSDEAQVELIEKAVHNAMLTCYAVEGQYPMQLSYLKENYGVAYDENRFSVFYDAFASNVMPEVQVRLRGGAGN